MIKTAVIGHPVAHSKSPLIHGFWLRHYGLQGQYDAIDIAPEKFALGVKRLVEMGYAGFNVTVPYKEKILELCTTLDPVAEQIGAVNTVVIENGKLRGLNTDSFGFAENMKQNLRGVNLVGKTALVLGAGGAARAVIHALFSLGCARVHICNRTRDRANALAEKFTEAGVIDWNARQFALPDCQVLVNTTTLGMAGCPPLELDLAGLPRDAIVADIVYKPLVTPLLQAAQNRGNRTVGGIGMLLHQARPAFQAWFGPLPDVTPDLQKMVMAT